MMAESSAYLTLLMSSSFILIPSEALCSTSSNIASEYKLKSVGESTHPWRTPFFYKGIFGKVIFIFADGFQYKLANTLMSFEYKPVDFGS